MRNKMDGQTNTPHGYYISYYEQMESESDNFTCVLTQLINLSQGTECPELRSGGSIPGSRFDRKLKSLLIIKLQSAHSGDNVLSFQNAKLRSLYQN